MTQTGNPFKKATKTRAKLRLALMGTSGSGKTYTALSVAQVLGKVAVIDTEHGSASKYASIFAFDVLELNSYHPQKYIEAIQAAAAAGYDVVIIDSLSHAWSGTGGALELVDQAAKRSQSKNSYMAWGEVTPIQNKLIEAMIGTPIHVIATLRSKTEYVLDKDDRGKSTPRKVGMAPVQRDGMEYEFDVVGELDMSNTLIITKSRVPELSGAVMEKPGKALGETLLAWLQDGAEAPPQPAEPQRPTQPPPAPPAPVQAAERPLQNGASTQNGATDGDGSSDPLERHFDQPPGDLGDMNKLPRTVDSLPVLGTLDMGDILRVAYAEKLVKGKHHFAALIDLLWRGGDIRAASTPDAVLDAIRKHEAERDQEREGISQ